MDIPKTFPPLWDFALTFYAKPQVAETCLFLQDHYDANVCLLIGLHWLDEQKHMLSSADLANLTAYTHRWTLEIIKPLRQMRRRIKQPFENYAHDALQEELRNAIKHAELLAEKKLLHEMECWLIKQTGNSAPAETSNLQRYLTSLHIDGAVIDSVQDKLIPR